MEFKNVDVGRAQLDNENKRSLPSDCKKIKRKTIVVFHNDPSPYLLLDEMLHYRRMETAAGLENTHLQLNIFMFHVHI